ncbi:MAG: FAD-binding oxidoreductase [Acidobacteria bacterium]|nr:MAG: FAD-binding oxidoreductase [Acidobacteriota bacterium]
MAEAALTELAGIVGESQCTAAASEREFFAVDGLTPGCVVYPDSAEQAAQTLEWAAGRDLAVIACGGATKLGIGNSPRKYDIALCTRNITKVDYYEPSDLTAGVGAGMALTDFQKQLKPDGLWLPLDLPGCAKGTLGGVVATNASGPLRHFYGAPRDMVVGMQIATPEGKLIRTGGRVVKNVAGYDLGKLMIGSYGTLGVITEVNLKLFPLPAECQTFVLSVGTLDIARDLRRRILALPIELLRMVLLDAEMAGIAHPGLQPGRPACGPQIWLEAGGSKSVIDRTRKELEAVSRAAGAKFHSCEWEASEKVWKMISDFANWFGKTYPGAVVLKGTMPIAHGEEFQSFAQQEAQNEKIKLVVVSLPGVGMLELGLLGLQNAAQAAGFVSRIRKVAEESGGALTVISATAEVKALVDVWGGPETTFELMRKLKAAWDPEGVLAPGRFVGSI